MTATSKTATAKTKPARSSPAVLSEAAGSAPSARPTPAPAIAPEVVPRPAPLAGPAPQLTDDLDGSIRILTCGSVDDGKSTLIGRFLWDASDLYDDQRETLAQGRRLADGNEPDFSLLVDGLVAEREQGITIDIAWRYFDSRNKRIVIIDSPGHEQYTRNMASGASHADVAIMLVDARHGIKRQTRRHAAILDLVGVKRVVLCVNKMDLVDWSEAKFREIEDDFRALIWRFGFEQPVAIPVSAVHGDNIARGSSNCPWYEGPTLIAYLATISPRASLQSQPFRMPVQTVLRAAPDFRGLAGTVSAGTVRVGETIVDTVSGESAKVARIVTFDGDLESAGAGRAVTLELDRDVDISRGAVLADPARRPTAAIDIDARLVWLSETAFDSRAGYLLRTATDLVPIAGIEIKALLDLETLATRPAVACAMNDIALTHLVLGRRTALDLFSAAHETGAVMLVDALSGATVAGGVVTAARAEQRRSEQAAFLLTREALARGVCADLKPGPEAQAEFRRRAEEVALLMRAAGVAVVLGDLGPRGR